MIRYGGDAKYVGCDRDGCTNSLRFPRRIHCATAAREYSWRTVHVDRRTRWLYYCPQHARDPLVGCLFAAVFLAVIICLLVAIATVAG